MTAQEIFAEILKKRGIKDVEAFANPRYQDLADPMLLPDVKPAIARLKQAIKNKEQVAVYGDYDIDGLTATTLLCEALSAWGLQAETFIPDRFVDGYGLTNRGIDELKSKGVSLLLTVDTGSLAHEHVLYAKQHGIDTIITDHHTVGATMPDAVATINPKRPDSKYPFKDMAGVGVAFTLVRAMQKAIPGYLEDGKEKWLLDLVALGTVCDVVPLIGENRILVYWGLHVMSKTRRPGLLALARTTEVDMSKLNTQTFGFRFGPRLNASGRLTHAKHSLALLQTLKATEAMQAAQELEKQNSQRRSLQAQIIEKALQQAQEFADDDVLIVAGAGWSHGVVGIAAAKLSETLAKPTFVLEIDGPVTKGSARSFGDFHLAEAIAAHKDLLDKGGGHAYAAGVTLASDQLTEFRRSMNDYYKALKLKDQQAFLEPQADVALTSLAGLDDELVALLQSLEPYGNAHEAPLFGLSGVKISDWRPVGADRKHAKLTIVDADNIRLDAIAFSLAERVAKLDTARPVSITAAVEHNEFRGRKTVQLMVKAIAQ